MTCEQIRISLNEILEDIDCNMLSDTHAVVSSPFMNLDGDYPEVHILPQRSGSIVLTDFGETFRSLANNRIDPTETQTRSDMLERIKALLGVSEFSGRFVIEVEESHLGSGLQRMFQALAFVEDMVFTARPREETVFKDRVLDLLQPLDAKLQQRVPLIGESKRHYTVDFYLHAQRSVWIEAISATTKSSFRAQVDHAHAMWSDAEPSVARISLLDDSSQVLDPGAIEFLKRVSDVQLWTKPVLFQERARQLIHDPFL